MQTLSSLISEPTENDRKAFSSVAGEIRPQSIALAFTPADLQLIADGLRHAEVGFCRQSQEMTTAAWRKSDGGVQRRMIVKADELFRKSCDARELSEKISAELRRAGK